MTKHQDLCLQRRSRPEQSDQRKPNQAANISHQPRASPDSTSLASRIEFPTMTGVDCRQESRHVRVSLLCVKRAALVQLELRAAGSSARVITTQGAGRARHLSSINAHTIVV